MEKNYSFMKNNVFFAYISHPVEFSIFPFVLGYERCSPNKECIGPREKPCHILHFVISGSGYLSIGNKEYHIQKDQLFYIPPNLPAAYRPDKSNPWEYMWIEFNGYNCKHFCDEAHISDKSPVCRPAHPEKFYNLFADLLEHNAIGIVHENSLRSTAALLNLFALLSEEKGDKYVVLSQNQGKLQPVLDYIHANFCNADVCLKTIAEETFFNESYLCRIFKQTIGISPQKYIINLRMQKACEMMKHGTFSIADISQSVGYKSPYYFSKEFKRIFNLPPSQYQQKAQFPQSAVFQNDAKV